MQPTVPTRVDPHCCPELPYARQAVLQARQRESDALRMLVALQRAGAAPGDLRHADDRADTLGQQRRVLELDLKQLIIHCARVA